MEISQGPLIIRQLFDSTVGQKLTWEKFREGIEIHRLQDNIDGANASLLRYEPGASLQTHYHLGHEYILILNGSQVDESGEHPAGTLLVYPPGSSHSIRSPHGCVVLIFRERPVSFIKPT